MKNETLQSIRDIAKKDFKEIEDSINLNQDAVKAHVRSIQYLEKNNTVQCTCTFAFDGSKDEIEASINYEDKEDGIYADADTADVATSILSAVDVTASTPIMAADDEEDAFGFDDPGVADVEDDAFSFDTPEDETIVEEEAEEIEDPEEEPSIAIENNIAGHYIAECSRCHGVFISALMESDQHVEFLSGICPLCEKESDQYIKWVIKPVEF